MTTTLTPAPSPITLGPAVLRVARVRFCDREDAEEVDPMDLPDAVRALVSGPAVPPAIGPFESSHGWEVMQVMTRGRSSETDLDVDPKEGSSRRSSGARQFSAHPRDEWRAWCRGVVSGADLRVTTVAESGLCGHAGTCHAGARKPIGMDLPSAGKP